jgi:hypothetical protein
MDRRREQLSAVNKRQLWELSDQEMASIEEDAWEQDRTTQAEIQEARAAYQSGDYVTIDDYIARRHKES